MKTILKKISLMCLMAILIATITVNIAFASSNGQQIPAVFATGTIPTATQVQSTPSPVEPKSANAQTSVLYYLPFGPDAGGVTVTRTGLAYKAEYLSAGLNGYTSGDYHDTTGKRSYPRAAIDFYFPGRDGQIVRAAAEGTVTKESNGCQVVVQSKNGDIVYYIHHHTIASKKELYPGVQIGKPVTIGQPIGIVGHEKTCGADGPHLHFAVFRGNQEIPVHFQDVDARNSVSWHTEKVCPAGLICPTHTSPPYVKFIYKSSGYPYPAVSDMNYRVIRTGLSSLTLSINGYGFIPKSVIRWNGQSLATTYVSSTELATNLSSNLLRNAGTFRITVFTPAPGGGTSSALLFVIVNSTDLVHISSAMQRDGEKVITGLDGAVNKVQLWDWLGGTNEKWYLVSAPIGIPNYYWIISAKSLKCLEVANSNNSPLTLNTCSFGNRQEFLRIERPVNVGEAPKFAFQSRYSKKNIDVTGWATGNGTVIEQYNPTFGDNQLWRLWSASTPTPTFTPTPNSCTTSNNAMASIQCATNTPTVIPANTPTVTPMPVPDIILPPRTYEYNWSTSGQSIQPSNTVYCSSNPDFSRVLYWRTTDTGGWVKWYPNVPVSGYYNISVYLPKYTSVAPKSNLAKYYLNGSTLIGTVDQNIQSCDWYPLGSYYMNPGDYVYMPTYTGENSPQFHLIAADGMKFVWSP